MRSRRKARPAGWRSNAGFTLVEVLVALLLFSLLSLALFGTVRVDASAWVRATSHADDSDRRIHAQDLLRHLIENAYPLYLSSDPASRRIDFTGSKNGLNFLSSAPMALANGGRSRVVLAIEPENDRLDLMLESNPELAVKNGQAEAARRPLVSGASAVAFSYFGRTLSGRTAEWHDDWNAQTELPRLVRVEVRFPASDGDSWPDLIVAPRIVADVGCVLDRLTTRCQGR
jgi:general secretion pathway protein J